LCLTQPFPLIYFCLYSHFVVGAGTANETLTTCSVGASKNVIYGWAPGSKPLLLPDNVGIAVGNVDGGFNTFTLQIHYNNPNLVANVTDSSGVIFYYSTTLREHQAAVFTTGDPDAGLSGEPVGNGLQEHSFFCPSSCSELALKQEVTVLQSALHMHKSGVRAYNELIRDNQVIRRADVPFFSFAQQGNQAARIEPYTVQPGDAFRTVCQYDATNNELFGKGSQEEMCMAFLLYYPRQTLIDDFGWICLYDIPFPTCSTNHTSRSLSTVSDLERSFGLPIAFSDAAQCQNPVINVTSSPAPVGSPVSIPAGEINETTDATSPTSTSTLSMSAAQVSGLLFGIVNVLSLLA
jgi:hypothetical protein